MTYTVKQYQEHLATAGLRLHRPMVSTMNRAAGNIKRDWRAQAAAKNKVHAPKYAGAIVMRRTVVVHGNVVATVEPRFTKRSQGPLSTALEFGGQYSAPQRSNINALESELPSLEKWLLKMAGDVLR